MAIVTNFTLILFIGATCGQATEERTAEQVIARYETAIERLLHCSVTAENKFFRRKARESTEVLGRYRKCQILRDNSRWNLLGYEEVYHPGTPEKFANEFNTICGDQVLDVFYPHEQFELRPDLPAQVHGRVAPTLSDRTKFLNQLDDAAFAFGYLRFDSFVSFSRLLKGTGISAAINKKDTDARGICVETNTPDGALLRLWFNPDASFLPFGMRRERTGTSLVENRSPEMRDYLQSDLGIAAQIPIKSVTYEVHKVQLEPWRDTHVIASFEAIETFEAEDGTKATNRHEVKFTDWNLDPDVSSPNAFRPILPVPEGTRVEVHDTPSIAYVYRDGRIEMDVNEATVAELQKVELPKRPVAPKVQWIWMAIAGVLAFVWWRIRSAKAD